MGCGSRICCYKDEMNTLICSAPYQCVASTKDSVDDDDVGVSKDEEYWNCVKNT